MRSLSRVFLPVRKFLALNVAKISNNYGWKRNCHSGGQSALVLCEDKDSVRHITLNNPKQRNILSWDVMVNLMNCIQNGITTASSPVHCIIIKAEGKVFSAGHDLKELTSENKENHLKLFNYCSSLMMAIQSSPVPVIAQVGGFATAAGCQLVASCDIVIAGESAKFSTPGANIGIFCSTPGVAVVRAVQRKFAAYMLFTGIPITAQEAVMHGLVSRLVPDDKLEDETMAVAQAIYNKSKTVQMLGKAFLLKQQTLSTADAYREGSEVMTENLKLVDAQRGIEAFANKQTPTWTHTKDRAH